MTEPIKGFDVSYYNKRVPYAALKAAGYDFAYIRVHSGFPEGHRNHEDMWREHYDGCRGAGIEVGPYWYAEEESPLSLDIQRVQFVELVRSTDWHLWPGIDVEDPDPSRAFLVGCDKQIDLLRQVFGRTVAYSYTSYRAQFLQGWEREGLLWWQADYRDAIRHDVRLAGAPDETGFGRPRRAPNASMHQHAVASIPGVYGLKIDQNITYDLDAFRIEPRGKVVELVGDRVPELIDALTVQLAYVREQNAAGRWASSAGLQSKMETIANVIEQDADAARGGS